MPVSRRVSVIVAATLTTWLAATGIAYAFLPKPANAVELFTTIDGRYINQHDLHGKIVLINFWATTCIICRAEMPELISVYRQYQSRGLEIIAVAMPYDNLPAVRQAVTSQALPFPVVYDREGVLARDYGAFKVTPVTVVLDKSGRRISQTIGIINFAKLRTFLDTSLAAKAA